MKKYLQIKVWELYDGKISIEEFEEWIYNNSSKIEKEETEEVSFEIISFNYKSKYSKQGFFSKFEELIDWKSYEERRINKILESIINQDEKSGESIIETYELRNKGYNFFEDLGMVNGLNLIAGFDYGMTTWEEIPKKEQEKLINENYPEAKEKAIKVKEWIKNGKVILTGKKGGELNRYIYTDNRNPEEIKDWIQERTEKKSMNTPSKKWWQIWKNKN